MNVPTGTPLKIPIPEVLVNIGTDGPGWPILYSIGPCVSQVDHSLFENVKESQQARRVAGITIGSRKLWCFNPNRPASSRTVSYPR